MEMGLKEVATEAKKEEKMEMGLKEAVVEAKKEEKMVMGLKEVESREIPAGFNKGCPQIHSSFRTTQRPPKTISTPLKPCSFWPNPCLESTLK